MDGPVLWPFGGHASEGLDACINRTHLFAGYRWEELQATLISAAFRSACSDVFGISRL